MYININTCTITNTQYMYISLKQMLFDFTWEFGGFPSTKLYQKENRKQ